MRFLTIFKRVLNLKYKKKTSLILWRQPWAVAAPCSSPMRSGSIHFFLQHIYLKKTNLIISGQDITGDYMSSASDNILHTQPLSLVIDQWFASFSDISREHFFVGVKEFFLSVGEICGEHLLVFGGDLQDLGRCRAASSASRPPPRNAGCHWDLQAFFVLPVFFFFMPAK